MPVIGLLFFASGFAALVYELLWFRQLGLIFGNTVHAATTVLTAYMLGLAAGAHGASRYAPRLRNPIRAFAFLEAAIGLYALGVPILFSLLQVVYRFGYQSLSQDAAFLTALRFVLAVLVLAVPTCCMGATLPILCHGLAREAQSFAARLGFLYGINTAGAVCGTLLCGFVLIPRLGLMGTQGVAVAVNLAIGLLGWILSRRDAAPGGLDPAAADPQRPCDAACGVLLLAVAASGFVALGFEVVWFRALILVFGSTTYSFSVMLGVFLCGIALGSLLLSGLSDRVLPAAVFGYALLGVSAYTVVSMGWFTDSAEDLLRSLADKGLRWRNLIVAKGSVTLTFLLVPTLGLGLAFTAGARAVRDLLGSSARSVAHCYTFNTIGAALGACVAGFLLLPAAGMERSLSLLAFMAAAVGLLPFLLSAKRAPRLAVPGTVLSLACMAASIARPGAWDPQVLAAGPYFSPWNFIRNGQIVLRDKLASERMFYYAEGVAALVSTIRGPDEHLYFSMDGKVEADTMPRSMMLQRMMGHLPLLFHPNPKSVLNIGLGAGVTFGACGCYPVDHLEVVEIEPRVREVAKRWGAYNHRILDDPRVTVTIDDGRNHLFCTRRQYDVITSDPFEPVKAGAAGLYTVDHFTQARSRLAAGGILAQYLPLYELSREDFLTLLHSFLQVFPESAIFFTGHDTILLGLKDGGPLDFRAVQSRFQLPAVKGSLADVGILVPEAILGMLVSDVGLAPRPGPRPRLHTDRFPIVEFSAPRSALRFTADRNQQALLDRFSGLAAGAAAGLTEEQRRVVDGCREALKTAIRASVLTSSPGTFQEGLTLLQSAARLAPQNPVVRNALAATLSAAAQKAAARGNFPEAAAHFQAALEIRPEDFWSHYYLVPILLNAGRHDEAKRHLDDGLRLYPDSPLFMALRGRYRFSIGEVDAACRDLRRALDALPKKADFWETYAMLLEAQGSPEEAAQARAKAQSLSPRAAGAATR